MGKNSGGERLEVHTGSSELAMVQRIIVTGANTGIGFALCKQLVLEHNCHVYLGARSLDKGTAAVADIAAISPEAAALVEPLLIDIASDESVTAAAGSLKERLGG